MHLAFCHIGIKGIAQAVTHQVKAEYGKEDEQARHEHQPGIDIEERLPGTDHTSPTRSRRLDAEAKIAQHQLEDDIGPDKQRGIHDNWSGSVRQDMAEHQAEIARPNRA
jgi:hypothetical protein